MVTQWMSCIPGVSDLNERWTGFSMQWKTRSLTNQYFPEGLHSNAIRWYGEVMPRGSEVVSMVSVMGAVSRIIYSTESRPIYRIADRLDSVSGPAHDHSALGR